MSLSDQKFNALLKKTARAQDRYNSYMNAVTEEMNQRVPFKIGYYGAINIFNRMRGGQVLNADGLHGMVVNALDRMIKKELRK